MVAKGHHELIAVTLESAKVWLQDEKQMDLCAGFDFSYG